MRRGRFPPDFQGKYCPRCRFSEGIYDKGYQCNSFHLSLFDLRGAESGGRRSKSVNITTACHCSGGQGLDDCLTAGIDCLEHVYYITQPQVERVNKEDRWVVYTPSYALNDQLLFKFSPMTGREAFVKRKLSVNVYPAPLRADLSLALALMVCIRGWPRRPAISLVWVLKIGMYWLESQPTQLGSAG